MIRKYLLPFLAIDWHSSFRDCHGHPCQVGRQGEGRSAALQS